MEDSNKMAPFGIEIRHSRHEVVEQPPESPASSDIEQLRANGDYEAASLIEAAAAEVEKIVVISRESSNGSQEGLLDIFTSKQVVAMADRVHAYLGSDLETHFKNLNRPTGYSFYVGRLAAHFVRSHNLITSRFSKFEERHSEPIEGAVGPHEDNSREYASFAKDLLARQLTDHYQVNFDIDFRGPRKIVDGRNTWARGISESQFLVVDYIREEIVKGTSSRVAHSSEYEFMITEDIGFNIRTILESRARLIDEAARINPILGQQLYDSIDYLSRFAVEVFHRGKLGAHRYNKEPESARRAILRVEELLVAAASMQETYADQEEIPVLDL